MSCVADDLIGGSYRYHPLFPVLALVRQDLSDLVHGVLQLSARVDLSPERPQDVSHLILTGFSPDSHRIHIRFISDSHQIHTRFTPDSHQIHIRFTPDSYQIHTRFISDSQQIHTRFISDSQQIHTGFTPPLSQTPTSSHYTHSRRYSNNHRITIFNQLK